MVGKFVTIRVRKELAPHVSHLRIVSTNRGIRNKGCISVSKLFHRTSFCFICSRLASGEKERDELRRNSDVIEILKNTQFPKICKTSDSPMPEKILGHERILWFGDLNCRIALSYTETRRLMEENHRHALLNKDQLRSKGDAVRMFCGRKEGTIYFTPMYKYYYNSDTYAGDMKNREKRELHLGNGIQQLCYIRGESRFSDHHLVCATFLVDVIVVKDGLKKKMPGFNMKVRAEELVSTYS